MGKRAAAPAKDQAQKHQKVEDPLLQELVPILQLVDQATLPDSVKEMLTAMVPHTLRSPKQERHKYQSTVLDVLSRVLDSVVAERQHAIEAAQRGLDEVTAETAPTEEAASKASDAEAAARAEMEAKAKLQKEAAAATAAAKEGVQKAQEALAASESAQAAAVVTKDEYQTLRNVAWEEVKNNAIPGRQWRQRDHKIEQLIEVLTRFGAEASVLAALPVALKAKAAERGSFAVKLLEYTEGLMAQHLEKLTSDIAAAESDVSAKKAAVEKAETDLKAAAEHEAKCVEQHMAAQNAWVDSTQDLQLAKKRTKEFRTKLEAASRLLRSEQSALEQVEVLRSKAAATMTEEHAAAAEQAPEPEAATAQEPKPEEAAAQPMEVGNFGESA